MAPTPQLGQPCRRAAGHPRRGRLRLVDVNHCPATALTRLPGISTDLADRIVRTREQAGGFSSAEDLGVLLDLPPATVDDLRDTAVFPPD